MRTIMGPTLSEKTLSLDPEVLKNLQRDFLSGKVQPPSITLGRLLSNRWCRYMAPI